MLTDPVISVLGRDPSRQHRINSNSFQQNAITTINGYQYVVYYTDFPNPTKPNACIVNLGRRKIDASGSDANQNWETISFNDYEQTGDDGHNIISVGICKGDGSIHLSFDQHCVALNFRIATTPVSENDTWDASMFSATQDHLPGLPHLELMDEVTYPRFVNVDDDLLLTYRIGEAGLGSDILYKYSAESHKYTYLGQYLTGVMNSPYINGLDYRNSRLHMSWCYRNFVQFDASTGPDAHKQQAGPNGPENNHDLSYAYSDDAGKTWKNSEGDTIAILDGEPEVGAGNTILPTSNARVFEIPMRSGILNQEAQTVDWEGAFWALNRENTSGEQQWILYHRDKTGKWAKHAVPAKSPPTERGSRASICTDRKNNVYLILPGNTDSSLSIIKTQKRDEEISFELVWSGEGYDGEPLIDIHRLEDSDNLSIFTRTDVKEDGHREVVVLNFELPM
ncbi:hypothetical protein ACMFMG_009816 [Clarireedia jacksonii]